MGWKAIRDHYKIEHIVQVTNEGICIGSQYIHNIIVISLEGEVKKRGGMGKLRQYLEKMDDDPVKLKELAQQEDTFAASNTVYTYEGGEIIECQCEEYGWPNVTHDGLIQYENTFSPDKQRVITWAINSARSRRTYYKQELTSTIKILGKLQDKVERCDTAIANLTLMQAEEFLAEKNASDSPGVMINFYECPKCGDEWEDLWDCAVEDDCPKCGERHISPHSSKRPGDAD